MSQFKERYQKIFEDGSLKELGFLQLSLAFTSLAFGACFAFLALCFLEKKLVPIIKLTTLKKRFSNYLLKKIFKKMPNLPNLTQAQYQF